jgi:hypothetical protein
MIELEPQPLPVASTAVVLCFANTKEAFISIQSFDLKTRRRAGLKTYNLTGKPTKLFQLDTSHLLVGTEGGKIEHWSIDEDKQMKIFDAHPESDAGISIIKELDSQSPLLRNALPDQKGPDNFRLLVTASAGSNIFRLWKVDPKTYEISNYF